MRTYELKKLLSDNRGSQVTIYSNFYSFKNSIIESVSDEIVKVSYSDEQSHCKQLYIQLDSIIAVEKI